MPKGDFHVNAVVILMGEEQHPYVYVTRINRANGDLLAANGNRGLFFSSVLRKASGRDNGENSEGRRLRYYWHNS